MSRKENIPVSPENDIRSTTAPRALNHLILLLIACICLALVIWANRPYFKKIGTYWGDFTKQKNDLDLEQRKKKRYGTAYTISKTIADHLTKINEQEKAVVLMPPTSYFEANKVKYHVPEPAIFYYYTGIKTVWHNTKDTASISWVAYIDKGELVLTKIKDAHHRDQFLQSFKQYKISL